jgi:hypothetical protein
MRHKALRSAILEVGLFYQKGWSVDHIAHFTYQLQRRRLRIEDQAMRARLAAARQQEPERLMVAYQIEEPQAESRVGYAIRTSIEEARISNQRLIDRVRAQLSKRLSRPEEISDQELPCAVCGEPAIGWTYVNRDRNGHRVTDGYATCAAHSSEEAVERLIGTRAG